jgi:hypothetical protein
MARLHALDLDERQMQDCMHFIVRVSGGICFAIPKAAFRVESRRANGFDGGT